MIQANGCWWFTGYLNPEGYGMMGDGLGKVKLSHRFYYETLVGPIESGLILDHTCHDPKTCICGPKCTHRKCVNPDHLEPVTTLENWIRGNKNISGILALAVARKNSMQCKRGHPFNEENTRFSPDGKRTCRACRRVNPVVEEVAGPLLHDPALCYMGRSCTVMATRDVLCAKPTGAKPRRSPAERKRRWRVAGVIH